jgi:hypothetical protein
LHRVHHSGVRELACCLRGRPAGRLPGVVCRADRDTLLACGSVVGVAEGARMWHPIRLHLVAI